MTVIYKNCHWLRVWPAQFGDELIA